MPSGMRSRRAELAARLLLDFRRHAGLGDGVLQVLELGRRAVVLAQLLADLIQALAQDRLLLPLVERPARLLVDVARDLQHLDALAERLEDAVEPRLEVEGGEDFLLLGALQVHEAGDDVGQRRDRLDALDRVGELARRLRQQLQGFHRPLAQAEATRLDLAVAGLRLRRASRCALPGRALC